MAVWTKADLADRVLENLGVKPASQSASAEDAARVSEIIESVHQRLMNRGLAPFASTATPEWAHVSMRDIVSADCASLFGISGEPLARLISASQTAAIEMARYVSIPHDKNTYPDVKFY
jgi:hypothetical protein